MKIMLDLNVLLYDYVITRNVSDFTESPVLALTPEVFMQRHPSET